MKIYLLLAHSANDSFNGLLADAYEQAARAKGHEVRRQNLGELHFDPVLRHDHNNRQPLEPDLRQAQANILWCNTWIICYPVWWGSVPALFKGFIDRCLTSNFAFRYHAHNPLWDQLLKGRSAYLISTSDAPGWWLWWRYRNSDINALKRATLEFCGFKPVYTLRIGRLRFLNERRRQAIIAGLIKKIPICFDVPAACCYS